MIIEVYIFYYLLGTNVTMLYRTNGCGHGMNLQEDKGKSLKWFQNWVSYRFLSAKDVL